MGTGEVETEDKSGDKSRAEQSHLRKKENLKWIKEGRILGVLMTMLKGKISRKESIKP